MDFIKTVWSSASAGLVFKGSTAGCLLKRCSTLVYSLASCLSGEKLTYGSLAVCSSRFDASAPCETATAISPRPGLSPSFYVLITASDANGVPSTASAIRKMQVVQPVVDTSALLSLIILTFSTARPSKLNSLSITLRRVSLLHVLVTLLCDFQPKDDGRGTYFAGLLNAKLHIAMIK